MHGNVQEWCSDYIGVYTTSPQTDPINLERNTGHRMMRGGCYNDQAGYSRSAMRSSQMPEVGYFTYGFRVAFAE